LEAYNLSAEKVVEELEIFREERRILTKDGMESLLDLFCRMVAQQDRPSKRKRGNRFLKLH
jgi:hypothetical protein